MAKAAATKATAATVGDGDGDGIGGKVLLGRVATRAVPMVVGAMVARGSAGAGCQWGSRR